MTLLKIIWWIQWEMMWYTIQWQIAQTTLLTPPETLVRSARVAEFLAPVHLRTAPQIEWTTSAFPLHLYRVRSARDLSRTWSPSSSTILQALLTFSAVY